MATNPQEEPIEFVNPTRIREAFNTSQYPEFIRDGTLKPEYLRNAHLSRSVAEEKKEPWCTQAQMIRYLDQQGLWCVEVFQYLHPEGTIGASGKPDPKRMRLEGRVLMLDNP